MIEKIDGHRDLGCTAHETPCDILTRGAGSMGDLLEVQDGSDLGGSDRDCGESVAAAGRLTSIIAACFGCTEEPAGLG